MFDHEPLFAADSPLAQAYAELTEAGNCRQEFVRGVLAAGAACEVAMGLQGGKRRRTKGQRDEGTKGRRDEGTKEHKDKETKERRNSWTNPEEDC